MRTGLIAKKLGMSSMFTDQGERITLTLLHVDKCQVVATRTRDKNGYVAVVVGAVLAKLSRVSKSMKKVFADSKIEPRAKLKEFRVSEENLLEVGKELTADHFEIGQYVDVKGKTIGKGFAGVMKRHNFRGLEASHGVSVSHRAHGSTGQCQDPGKVFKGKKMAGHMGDVNVTMHNLKIVDFNVEQGLVIVSGSVPGSKGSYVYITDAIKKAVTI
jgi:large subunit ribosomal protein L3